MIYLAAALVVVASFAGDLLAHALSLSAHEQHGWSVTSTLCLIGFAVLIAFKEEKD